MILNEKLSDLHFTYAYTIESKIISCVAQPLDSIHSCWILHMMINISGMDETPKMVLILSGPGYLENHNPFMTVSWFESQIELSFISLTWLLRIIWSMR